MCIELGNGPRIPAGWGGVLGRELVALVGSHVWVHLWEESYGKILNFVCYIDN